MLDNPWVASILLTFILVALTVIIPVLHYGRVLREAGTTTWSEVSRNLKFQVVGWSAFWIISGWVFIIMSMAFFYPTMAGLGIAVYAYLGYPLFFGYRWVSTADGPVVEIDEAAGIISLGYGVLLVVATLSVETM